MYHAPISDMLFVMKELAGLDEVAALPGYEDATPETAQAVLEEASKLCGEVLAPLNVEGDRNPSRWENGSVFATPGFADAFRQFSEGGWQGVQHPPEYEGQGLPKLVATPCVEMLNAANLSFALCPLLTDGAIEALLTAGSEEQKQRYVPKLISGEWTGTMNLTEPQAGSDLAMVRTRAEPQGDGTYRLFGTKIFITWGEHDMAKNIVHLVLARTPSAPEGVKGISLFVVPKFVVNDDGSLGERNDVHCVSIEHKLGIKASPTAVLQFGDHGGAIGHLIGDENRGLEYMFIMMNAARFAVGMQGVAVSDRAYQKAVAYAKERVQSRPVDGSTKEAATIIHHPDVRRMLATMRALTEASRALAYVAAAQSDIAHRHPDEATRARHQARYEFFVPVVKGWSTELSIDVASLGVQVHGGMGFIEETGAAQFYRDARILPIYEGTTAIQANDLIGRKTLRDGGAVAKALIGEIGDTIDALDAHDGAAFASMRTHLARGRDAFASAVDYVLANAKRDPNAVFAGSVPYLKLAGIVLGGWQMARALLAAQRLKADDPKFYGAKIATAQFFAEHLLPQAVAFEAAIVSANGSEGVLALSEDQF
ncbi:acyl-CoA dehydrogenase [Paraburkholderia caballeronis]|uniref:3-methylmercaptopropionyl-CoA dehydrogenase n=1 Tax=Paraburkholderia caballeronis TaxID=416943 RepID=A0A1H7UPN2_9BURK|nr:acyl-CoA dehydrogenase [Paraburkholderia caballeronis]PXW26618.1 alkylation response protein AidB-like acyl-CoA dehydrogenase [Paraburkholderia caballeronis]PXX02164.1 alkylation response protein AidB-like acyl-CoA dehydrogenase [Paraburkholderia caballeronis]RAK01321.1 alkylation response protein AidB-like acyl-CoA dehydrogenase [Paraburkholderia caballeronis]SEB85290.1 Acyl-CoA dehydrogenase [Paraburkholderia caballeronis]SEL98724.1 Acyl-CoA dehydrogenase [Paraburkholderia caballeronis]